MATTVPPLLTTAEKRAFEATKTLPDDLSPIGDTVVELLRHISQLRLDMANISGLLDPEGKSLEDVVAATNLARLLACFHQQQGGL